jgi:hypothetical protein
MITRQRNFAALVTLIGKLLFSGYPEDVTFIVSGSTPQKLPHFVYSSSELNRTQILQATGLITSICCLKAHLFNTGVENIQY